MRVLVFPSQSCQRIQGTSIMKPTKRDFLSLTLAALASGGAVLVAATSAEAIGINYDKPKQKPKGKQRR
jgi:hypothetical protein